MRRVLQVLCAALLGVLAALGGAVAYLRHDLPQIRSFADYRPKQGSQILADDGTLLAHVAYERRTVVPYAALPSHVIQAFIAAEDAHFFAHEGIDYWGIVRAVLKNMRPGARLQGASTITQQTVKTLVLGPERSYARKLREALLARELEQLLEKEEILGIYLNQIYFGSGAYGVEEAAQTYFGRSVRLLDLGEAALLAAIPKNPAHYNIRAQPQAAKARQRYVLAQMQAHGFVTAAAAQAAAAAAVPLPAPAGPGIGLAPHFVAHVQRLLTSRYGEAQVFGGGLRVYTGLAPAAQQSANAAVRDGLATLARRQPGATGDTRGPGAEAALVAIDPRDHWVRALVGGRDATAAGGHGFNRATQARRQPGSAYKPVVYAAALAAHAITPASFCPDAPVPIADPWTGQIWRPENYEDGRYDGTISYRAALVRSKNTCAVRLLQRIGPATAIATGVAMGIASPQPANLTLALGTGEVTPLELADVYATLADGGRHRAPGFIRRVLAPDGRDLAPSVLEGPAVTVALTPAASYVLTDMLTGVMRQGAGRRAAAGALARPLAGKSGTSQRSRDAWFAGYAPQLAAAVWVGRDDDAPLGHETGTSAALPVWSQFMAGALGGAVVEDFLEPEGVVRALIDPRDGLPCAAAGPTCTEEVFVAGTEPAAVAQPLRSIFLEDE